MSARSAVTHRVGARGQVVIPKDIRERAGLYPGAAVAFALEGDRVVISLRRSPACVAGRFALSGMAARLLLDRAAEPR